jgi:hypothetical protein
MKTAKIVEHHDASETSPAGFCRVKRINEGLLLVL